MKAASKLTGGNRANLSGAGITYETGLRLFSDGHAILNALEDGSTIIFDNSTITIAFIQSVGSSPRY